MNYFDSLPLELQEYIYDINYREFKINHQENYIYVLCELNAMWNHKNRSNFITFPWNQCTLHQIDACLEISAIGLINRATSESFLLPSEIKNLILY